MNNTDDITALKAEISALKTEIEGLKEFVKAMYSMMSDEEDYESSELMGNVNMGRYNT